MTNSELIEQTTAAKSTQAQTPRLEEDVATVIEAFWEFDVAFGSSLKERQAAVRIQKAFGFASDWDLERIKRAS